MTYSKVTEPLHEMKAFLEEQQQRFDGLIKGKVGNLLMYLQCYS